MNNSPEKKLFFDYASITPIDPAVREVMIEGFDLYANPSSIHTPGQEARRAIERARMSMARIMGVKAHTVLFTSGGTESVNLAIRGVYKRKRFTHMVTSSIEHPAVLETCRALEKMGVEVSYVDPEPNGVVSARAIEEALRPETGLVSVMYVNNELGTIQPVRDIARGIRAFSKENGGRMLFHTDASQAPTYLSIGVDELGVDLLTLDGSKCYGPRGIGVLVKQDGVGLDGIIYGGGQEAGLRSGTESAYAILGLAKALEIAEERREHDRAQYEALSEQIISGVLKIRSDAELNGDHEQKVPGIINICFPGLDGEFAVIKLDSLGVACSTSSACMSAKEEGSSYVLKAIGKKACAGSSLRISIGRLNTENDVAGLLEALEKVVS